MIAKVKALRALPSKQSLFQEKTLAPPPRNVPDTGAGERSE
jgi:hypothetical protein